MPTPNHPKLPLCSELAAQPGRHLFAYWLDALLTDPFQEIQQADAYRLMGMLAAYQEQENLHISDMLAELRAFAFGATV